MTDLRLAGWKTDAGRREYLAAYDAALELWTAPYESVEISSRFGPTRGIASGPIDGPVMLLLPAATGMGAIQWYPNAGSLAAEHRVIALDFVAGPGGGAQTGAMVDRHDYAAWLTDVLDGIGVDRARFVGPSLGGWCVSTETQIRDLLAFQEMKYFCPSSDRRHRGPPFRSTQQRFLGSSDRGQRHVARGGHE